MSVHTGDQPQANGPSDSLRHFTLVAWSQACVLAVLDLAHLRNVFGHDAEVLVTNVLSAFASQPYPLPRLPPNIPCSDPSGSNSTGPAHPTSAAGSVLTSSTSTARLR